MELTFAIIWGFALDSLLGDPHGLWHPVQGIGWLITRLERLLRAKFPRNPAGELAAGVFLWAAVCSISFLVPYFLLYALNQVSHWLGFAAETLLCWQILARKSLCDAGRHVERALRRSPEEGRRAIACYVGRDTSALDEPGVIRAAVETIAENTTDGVVAPLVFLFLGGAPLGMLYKAVNTLDSMVGYRNDRYEYFGKFSARMDDLANYLPARLSALLLLAAAALLDYDAARARRVWRRDRRRHKSPNSAQTESVCAGALGVQLGGDAVYFGRLVRKPAIGDARRPAEPEDIGRTAELMTAASVLALCLGAAVRLLLAR